MQHHTHFEYGQWIEARELPTECIEDCSAAGRVDDAVAFWRTNLKLTSDPNVIDWLVETGAWGREEMALWSEDERTDRVLWLVCCDLREGQQSPEDQPQAYIGI